MLKTFKKYHQRSYQQNLGPWQTRNPTEQSDHQMQEYCDKLLPIISQPKTIKQKINDQFCQKTNDFNKKKRPRSNAALMERINKQNGRLKMSQRAFNCQHQRDQNKEHFQLNFTLVSTKTQRKDIDYRNQNRNISLQKNSNRTLKNQKRPTTCLQEVNIQNFLVEGSRESQRQGMNRRKQSAFVMKHKFAQIRRSMNIPSSHQINYQNKIFRGCSQDENKENWLLKLARYDGNN